MIVKNDHQTHSEDGTAIRSEADKVCCAAGDIGALLMSCQAASGNVIALLSESLLWPDSIGVSKAVEAAQRLVLGTPSRLSAVDAAYVCRQMMGTALSALRSAESKELYLALITDIFAALGEKNEVAGQVRRFALLAVRIHTPQL
jgi:hypothetical protein